MNASTDTILEVADLTKAQREFLLLFHRAVRLYRDQIRGRLGLDKFPGTTHRALSARGLVSGDSFRPIELTPAGREICDALAEGMGR